MQIKYIHTRHIHKSIQTTILLILKGYRFYPCHFNTTVMIIPIITKVDSDIRTRNIDLSLDDVIAALVLKSLSTRPRLRVASTGLNPTVGARR